MTTSTLTLPEFLLARIAEDEAVALAAMKGKWWHDGPTLKTGKWWIDAGDEAVGKVDRRDDAEHIVRFDPARVLADCKAKRAIVEMADEATGLDMQVDSEFRIGPRDEVEEPYLGDAILRALASVYADHEDFDAGWAG